ncbi:MAG: AbrB/MazE/SpoVT family DNA-binding domain-containing protein [Candidatus Pacearchaeota archaeon]
MAIEVKTKKWGNSIGVVIPVETADRLNLKPEETVIVEITKKENVLKELFGSLKFKKSTEQILREVRENLESKWSK